MLFVVACKNALSRFRQCRQGCFRCKTGTRKRGTHPFTEMFKALLLRQKNQAVAQTQDGEGRTRAQPEVLAKLLRDCELSLLTDLRRGQIFESRQPAHKPSW